MDLQIALHRGQENVTRLRFLSGMEWSNTNDLFQRVGMAPGMRCLDVRCGAGQVSLPLARLTGPEGLVVGIDPEERLLAKARNEAARLGLNADFRVGDFEELGDRREFNLVYTRFLLSQRSRPEAEEALRRMMHVVRPGGTIVVEDLDCPHGKEIQSVENPAYVRFLELFNALMRDEETESEQGTQLPTLLQHAGVASVQCQNSPSPSLAVEQGRNPASLVLDSIRHAIVAAHLATRTEVDRLGSELDRFRCSPQSLFWLPRIVQVWGSVPPAEA